MSRSVRLAGGDNLLWASLLIFVLFLPTTNFYFYYGFILSFAIILLLVSGEFSPRSYAISGFLILVGTLSLYRTVLYGNPEDLKEFVKFLVAGVVMASRPQLDRKLFEKILSVFVVVNFLYAIVQYTKVDLFGVVGVINSIYNADMHIAASLSYDRPRVLGLSAGPAQQGIISLLCFLYFAVVARQRGRRSSQEGGFIFPFVISFVAFSTMILAQSKTVYVAFFVGIVFVFLGWCVVAIARKSILSTDGVIVTFALAATIIVVLSADLVLGYFPQLGALLSQGLGYESVHNRFDNWQVMLAGFGMVDNPAPYMFGLGRSFLEAEGLNDIPYDSDYLYFIVNYGALGALFLILSALFLIFYPMGAGSGRMYGAFLKISLPFLFVVSVFLNVWVDPRSSMFLVLVATLWFRYQDATS